jgi:NADH:ubiquinone oxidoreductase subunit 6 (subunit J)
MTYIKKNPRRWFYVAMAVLFFAVALGVFYIGAHYTGAACVAIFVPAIVALNLVPRMLRAAWTGDDWRV